MRKRTALNLFIAGCLAGMIAGCASTKVDEMNEHVGELPKPDQVLVYNFAVSPDEVELDKGLTAKIEELVKKTPRTDAERAAGRQVADALAAHLVKEIQALGLPASRTSNAPPRTGSTLLVKGQFISIDEGNRTERVVIGLGLGRTDVKAITEVYDASSGKQVLASQFETDAKSGDKPGAAETMGVGAATGNLAVSAAATAGTTALSETIGATVEADADRTAKKIAAQLKQYCVMQGWIQP